jgi:hypothetical protein
MTDQTDQPEVRNGCPLPPYNTLNFTADSPAIFETLQNAAKKSPNYPLPPGTNRRLIADNQANVAYFSGMNQKTQAIKTQTQTGPLANLPYPQFKTEGERLKYRQGLASTAARSILVPGQNPVGPASVYLITNYQIINS